MYPPTLKNLKNNSSANPSRKSPCKSVRGFFVFDKETRVMPLIPMNRHKPASGITLEKHKDREDSEIKSYLNQITFGHPIRELI
jgi:hypothetical protein